MLVSCTYLGIITIPPSVTKFLDVSLSVLASTAIGSRRCFCFPYIAGHANFQEYMTDMTGISRAPIIHLDKKIYPKSEKQNSLLMRLLQLSPLWEPMQKIMPAFVAGNGTVDTPVVTVLQWPLVDHKA